jgi:hypothetical protein
VAATSDQQTAPILRAVVDALRTGLLKKLPGLSEEDARRSTVDSGSNLAGLLQHLTFVESKWFEENVAGGKAKGNRSMRVDPSISLQSLRSDYRAACQTSIVPLQPAGSAGRVALAGPPRTLSSTVFPC